jgi:NAD(P)-dependent dehydrogenase (short-subunit alcohol dehydrogenase family)
VTETSTGPATGPSSGPLTGRVVLVTGGGNGLGRGLCVSAAAQGATVVVAAPGENAATTVAQIVERGGAAVWQRCDVTDGGQVAEAIAATVSAYGGLHAIVHNATSRHSSRPTKLEDVTDEAWDDHVAVSLRAAYLLAHHGFEHLKATRGRLVLMTSPAGMEGSTTLPAYGAVKGALRGFAKSLAIEWGPDQIAVACISPLATGPALSRAYEQNPELEARLTDHVPAGRVGDPEHDIGPVVSFLVGPEAGYVTGQTIVVDGGRFTTL